MSRTATQVSEERYAKLRQLEQLMDQYKTDRVDPNHGVPIYEYPDGVEVEVANRQKELSQLSDEYTVLSRAEVAEKTRLQIEELQTVQRKYDGIAQGSSTGNLPRGFKSLGHAVVDSAQYRLRGQTKGRFTVDLPDVDFKTLLTEGSPGFAPANPRTDLVVPFPNRPIRVTDLIPITPTDLQTVYWMEETTFTNNASMTGEGYTKPESTVDYTQRSSPVRKVAHVMSITEEVMDDVPGFMSLINNDMILMLGLKEEDQLVNGTGIGQELTGFLNNSNLQSQGFVTNNADTILKAFTKVQWTGYGTVTAIVMNPSNWETTRLIKGATNQDYVLGSPLIDITPRLWGVPVVVTNVIAAGTALVGDFSMFSEIRRKKGVTIDVSNSHSTYFVEDKLAIRAEMREALLIKRGSAFCKATSLT